MSPKKFQESSSVRLKQTNLHAFFGVTKSLKEPVKKSNVKIAKKPPKMRSFKKKPLQKKKITDLESDDDECESYFIAKTQKECSMKNNEKVLALNKPTPLKRSYKSNLKVEQVRRNIIAVCEVSLMQREVREEVGEVKVMEDKVIEIVEDKVIEISEDKVKVESLEDKDIEFSKDKTIEVRPVRRSLEGEDERSKESPKKIKTEDSDGMINSIEIKREIENLSPVKRNLFKTEDIFEPLVEIEENNEFVNTEESLPDLCKTEVKEEPSEEEVDLDATIINLKDYGIFEEEFSDDGYPDPMKNNCDESLKMKTEVDTFVDFNEIINYVVDQPNLFSVLLEEEQRFLKRYMCLHEKYRFFSFRLFTRQLIWYEVGSLRTNINLEMDDEAFQEMIKVLKNIKIIQTDYTKEEPIDLLNRLNANDVKAIYQSFKLKTKCSKKDDYVKAIVKHCSSQSTLTFAKSSDDLLVDRIREKMGDRVKLDLNFYNILARVHLLYSFMNPDFIRPSDLYFFKGSVRKGINVLPKFVTDFTKIFKRETFLRYFLAVEQYNEFMIAKEKNSEKKMLKIAKLAFEDFKQIIKDGYNDEQTTVLNFHKRFTAGRVLAKIISMACKQFTRESNLVMEWLQFLVKQDQYALRMRGEWYNHIAMIHEKKKEYEWAVDLLIEAFVDPNVPEISKYELSYRSKRLLAKCEDKDTKAILSELIVPPPDEVPFPDVIIKAIKIESSDKMRLSFKLNGSSVCVEEYALNHYRQLGYSKGVHTEGRLMTTMYILLFWDIIFNKYIPGTFVSEIQYVPLDFFSSDFYHNRKTEIDMRLEEIEKDWSQEELVHQLSANILENGKVFTVTGMVDVLHEDILMDAVQCIGRRVLRKIFERFVKSFRDYRAGMPDLFICNPNTLRYKFVEVKSENDILSMKQTVWLEYLRSIGADIEICHVYSEGKKVKRKLLKNKSQ